jgi:hypothetical protein
MLIVVGAETLTVAGTAVSLTIPTPSTRPVEQAEVIVTDADIVYQADGTTPTASDGGLYRNGERFIIKGVTDLANFKAIRRTSTSSVIYITYFREEN